MPAKSITTSKRITTPRAQLCADQWFNYEPGGPEQHVSPGRWGKDHWETLAYAETRTVDGGGLLHNSRMRCHLRLHREFAWDAGFGANDGSKYPTRLRGNELLEHHDDWSCLEDLAAFGLVELEWHVKRHGQPLGGSEARVRLTGQGQVVVAALRAHKAAGGNFSNFPCPVELL